jgi:hypothetical protein
MMWDYVGRVANLRPIANRPSARRSFLPPETFPRGLSLCATERQATKTDRLSHRLV